MRTQVGCIAATLLCVLFVPVKASAQSAIAGIVKDTSGAVLPGVTVEASSPALIERTRNVVSDAQGTYKIVDLRPGVYTVTFSLTGFATVKREGLELPSNFTMSVNADLRVGSLQETVTVTGESPVVDVQTNTRAAVLSRDILDAVPNSHTLQSVGQLVVGVTLTAPDVGGSQAMQQTYFSVHGAGAAQTAVLMDGMIINGLQGDGAIQSYMNDAGSQEMVYQTGGGAADSTSGGVRINLIPERRRQHPPWVVFRRPRAERRISRAERQPLGFPAGQRRENAGQDRPLPRHRADPRRPGRQGQVVVLRVGPRLHGEQADFQHVPRAGGANLRQLRQRGRRLRAGRRPASRSTACWDA